MAAVDEIPGEWAQLYEWAPVTLDGADPLTNDAVYSVLLVKGDKVQAFSEAGRVDFKLFAPGSGSVDTDADIATARGTDNEGFPDIDYSATQTGEYYVDAYAPEASGVTTDSIYISWVPFTALTRNGAAAQAVSYAQRAGISCTLRDGDGAAFDLKVPVQLWRSVAGGAWDLVTTLAETENPVKSYTAPITTRTAFKMVVAEDEFTQGSTSAIKTVIPGTSLQTPIAPAKMSHSKYSTIFGTLKPRHTARTTPVRIYKWRLVSGKWKSAGYSNAKASNYLSFTKYASSVRLPYAGKWRVRAYSPADSGHAATWSSGYDYVTVK